MSFRCREAAGWIKESKRVFLGIRVLPIEGLRNVLFKEVCSVNVSNHGISKGGLKQVTVEVNAAFLLKELPRYPHVFQQ